jgi:transcriptional regulator with XRE-family HTH domain
MRGDELAAIRAGLGLSLRAFAPQVDVSHMQVANYESGKAPIPPDVETKARELAGSLARRQASPVESVTIATAGSTAKVEIRRRDETRQTVNSDRPVTGIRILADGGVEVMTAGSK